MKVVVMPIGMQIGGSEINAIDLAATVSGRGHEVVVIGRPGPMGDVARRSGLRVIDADIPTRGRPRPASVRAIRRVIVDEKPDLVHVYEAPSCTEAFYAVGWRDRVPLVATIYGMQVDDFMPRAVPTIAGTADIEDALRRGRDPESVFRLEPPVDARANGPGASEGLRQRREWHVADNEELVVIVSRLDIWMKMDSLMDTIDAVGALADRRRIRLVIVGDGPAREALERRSDAVNRRHGRVVVQLAGSMIDPVPAYRAADVVVGMGTSVLRGMAVGKPAILAGELGHVQMIRPETVAPLLRQGFWGVGDGTRATDRLAGLLTLTLDLSPEDRQRLGEWSRSLVVDRFGLEVSTDRLLEIYERVLSWSPSRAFLAREALRVPPSLIHRKVTDRAPGRRRGIRALSSPANIPESYQSAMAWLPRKSAQSTSKAETMSKSSDPSEVGL